MTLRRDPYNGSTRKLVLAFDVGTTYSGVSYRYWLLRYSFFANADESSSLLEPGVTPEIRAVTRFPEQEHVGGDAKIPSVIYYDCDGKVKAVGAEAMQVHIQEEAKENDWYLATWFKLHLKPEGSVIYPVSNSTNSIPSLPPNKSAQDVFSDFIAYLFKCTKKYIIETVPDRSFWSAVQDNIDFVLSHPNGWVGRQQYSMRRAAVKAGLIPDTSAGHARLTFVTEGEASLHFCIHNHLNVPPDESVMIVDAGGGTIDLSAYKAGEGSGEEADRSRYEEITTPEFIPLNASLTRRSFCGVNLRDESCSALFPSKVVVPAEKLARSRFRLDLECIVQEFDKTAKPLFKSASQPVYIKFGSFRDNDKDLQIRNGQLTVSGTEVERFFEPSWMLLMESIIKVVSSTRNDPIQSVFLVGGFGANQWLYSKLEAMLDIYGITLCRPQSNLLANKATADGAVSFYLDHFVTARVARWSYGTDCVTKFNPKDLQHLARNHSVTTRPSGKRVIPNKFSCILSKDTRVSETREFRHTYTREAHSRLALQNLGAEILVYRGSKQYPKWTDVDSACYSVLCTVKADTLETSKTLSNRFGPNGNYFVLEFDIILLFGLTELKAQIAWTEQGVEKRCPAELIYDSD
ncbi:hypothetical protein V5O48_008367 [Marasmius crinis-equi]|uniref:Uncharacterized protein n=1 Tax=Marasmius crinis-equi TaxID=585013 RepID=A0ABR3FEB2_9AGAR